MLVWRIYLIDYKPIELHVCGEWGIELDGEAFTGFLDRNDEGLTSSAGGSRHEYLGISGNRGCFDYNLCLPGVYFGSADRGFGFAVIAHPGVGTFI